jgi:hypothetical protein
LNLDKSDQQAMVIFQDLIDKSVGALFELINDGFHAFRQYWEHRKKGRGAQNND